MTREHLNALAQIIQAAQDEHQRNPERWQYFSIDGWAGKKLTELLKELQQEEDQNG